MGPCHTSGSEVQPEHTAAHVKCTIELNFKFDVQDFGEHLSSALEQAIQFCPSKDPLSLPLRLHGVQASVIARLATAP